MKKVLSVVLFTAALTGCATSPPASPITSLKINLPDTNKWSQITSKSTTNQYIREWVPEGLNGDDTKWIIVEQKFALGSSVSAEKYIKGSFALAKSACSDVAYNGPEKIDVKGHETYVGRFMCAQQNGKSYGAFTDQRVVTQENEVYVITSELRIPSAPKAGILSFKKDQLNEMLAFMRRQGVSAKFVRNSVEICTAGSTDCK
ncbi:hypothetical protein [Crenobacter cavernae]|uniref:hypothetical protein n=1 Tax=Crenobacter cavernae TaxID=2290923 RepID=UPI0011C026C4|nr:hypothetical protein [Crenobacter cavernae]